MLTNRSSNGRTPDESLQSWTANADTWDRLMGDGNSFHNELVVTTQLGLIGDGPFDLAIELACGNGNFLSYLSERARRVIAVDGSIEMLARARRRTVGLANCSFVETDLTRATAADISGGALADLVVCTMALMDIASLDVLASTVSHLLTPEGAFVATVAHPAFFGPSPRAEKQIRYRNVDGRIVPTPSLIVSSYKTDQVIRARADPELPEAQPYYMRSLESLLLPFLSSGLALTAIREPVFQSDEMQRRPVKRLDEWRVFPDIPPVLGFQLSRA
jgi:SAM-dependent methyltransferase